MASLNTAQENLTRRDLCDCCGSSRRKIVAMPSGLTIQFCNHHWAAVEENVTLAGGTVIADIAIPEKEVKELQF